MRNNISCEVLYNIDICAQKVAYMIGIADFECWLAENKNNRVRFYKDLCTMNMFEVAYDYSIPIVLVKYYMAKIAQKERL